MPIYEYKVVPAPAKGKKAKGVRGAESRFAFALEELMNQMGQDGWEYQRAETLPSEERHGLTNYTTTYRSMMVFRRPVGGMPETDETRLLAPPAAAPSHEIEMEETPEGFFSAALDNGVENANDLSSPAANVLMERAARLKKPAQYDDADDYEDAPEEPTKDS